MRGLKSGYGKRMRGLGLVAGLAAIALSAGGCSSGQKVKVGLPDGFDVRGVSMFNGRTGEAISWEDLQLAFAEADVVLIGEQHGHPVGLPVATAMFEDALAQNEQMALALEFFGRDYQLAIDDYLADITDEEAFKKASRRSGSSYPAGHREMLEAAKAAERPVVAAMVPRRYTLKLTSKDGFEKFEKLNERQLAMMKLPETMPESGEYHKRFFDLMSGIHGSEDEDGVVSEVAEVELTAEEREAAETEAQELQERIQKMFHSMNTWDVTMADSVLGEVRRGSKPVVLVVGQFHSDFGGGIPQRLMEADADLFIWTISMQDAWSDELREEDQDRADCVVYVGPMLDWE